jgi:hypothetical protein
MSKGPRTTQFDRIFASSPLDAKAGRVTAQVDEVFESKKKITQQHSDVPLPMRPIPRNSTTPNLINRSVGRLTVAGLSATGKSRPNRGALWVVRCVCGRYETRRTSSILSAANASDACEECRQTAFIQQQAARR